MSPPTGLVGRIVRGDVAWPRVLLAALATVTAVALVALAATSATAFGIYNPSWDGSSDFRGAVASDPGTDLEIVRATGGYDEHDPAETVAFVTAPAEPYEGADARRLRTFVERGGRLVVLENFGATGNALLERVGAETRADGRLLRDERNYERGPAMPVATEVNGTAVTGDVDRLTLNYATAVDPGPDATVLVRTSPYAYLGDEDVDLAEAELGSYPVAAVEPVGDGEVVVVGDPSITINAMFDEPDNRAFLAGLSADRDVVIVDVSHAGGVPPLRAAVLTLRDSSALALLVGLAGIAAIARVRPRPRRWLERVVPDRLRPAGRRDPPVGDAAPESLDAARAVRLREAHPDWDEARIRRVITALNRTRRKGERDE